MKILATSDWQAGVATVTLADQEQVWHRIVDVAIEREVDLFVHGGDVYEGPLATMEQLAAVRRVFNRLRAAGIPILVIRGNSRHDLALKEVDALDVFRDYDGITVSTRPEVHNLAAAGVDVCTLPWVSPARLVADLNGDVDREHLNDQIARMLVQIAERLASECTAAHKILVAHWAISGSALPTGMSSDDLGEPVLPWAELDALGFDAVIGAHIHKAQLLTTAVDRTLGFVCGSPQPLNFGEEGYEHGVWLVDVGLVNEATFVPIESREFKTLDYRMPDTFLTAPAEQTLNFPMFVDGAIVRVRYTATEEQAKRVDQAGIRAALLAAGAHRVQFQAKIEREARTRAKGMTESLGPLEALALYCKANDVAPSLSELMASRLKAWSET